MKYIVPFLLFLANVYVQAKSWEILLYMDSSYELSHAAIKNITDLVKGRLHIDDEDSVRICIQIHCLAREGKLGNEAYRYIVKGNALCLSDYTYLSYNPIDDLVDSARWAFTNNPDAYTMLILWNHGSGIIDKNWSHELNDWAAEHDVLMNEACPLYKKHREEAHKGLLFMQKPKIYMPVSHLAIALGRIQNTLLSGRKIDVIGFDMCMMSMVEVAYEIASSVHYIIGSQDCELDYGWDYATVFSKITSTTKPADIGPVVVNAYQQFYATHARIGTYTHSATDMNYIEKLKQNIDTVATGILACVDAYGDVYVKQLSDMRQQLPKFCMIPMYTDLYDFYNKLEELMSRFNNFKGHKELVTALQNGKNLINSMVIANCAGDQRPYAHGISLYFPLSHIDSSYTTCQFAQGPWMTVLQKVIQNSD